MKRIQIALALIAFSAAPAFGRGIPTSAAKINKGLPIEAAGGPERFLRVSLEDVSAPSAEPATVEQAVPPATAAMPAWEVTLAPNDQAKSDLTIQNHCTGPHNFNVNKEDMAFLQYSVPGPLRVDGHQSFKLPVVFNTSGLAPGQYRGVVLVLCLDCRAEPNCTQDRENLPVVLTVVAAPKQQDQPSGISVEHGNVVPMPQGMQEQPRKVGDPEEYFLPGGMPSINRATALRWWGSPFPPPGVWWCCCCCQQQPVPVPPAPEPRNPSAAPSLPVPSVTVGLDVGKFGPGKAIYVLYAAGTPGSAAQYVAQAYIQWNASGGTGQLTGTLEVQGPGSSSWQSVVSGMGPNDEHLFVTHAPGTYTFRATVKDSNGKSSFNTLTVTFPSI